jgi:hypothetical protein
MEVNMTEETPASPAAKKERSPNYPAFSLVEALTRVRVIWDHEKTAPVPAALAIGHLGFTATSSSGLRSLATLLQFGLLEAIGRGDGKLVKVTERARLLIRHPDQGAPEYLDAIRAAALSPRMHSEMWEYAKSTGAWPSDKALRWKLESEYGFSGSAIDQFLAEMRESFALAKLPIDGSIDPSSADAKPRGAGGARLDELPPPPPPPPPPPASDQSRKYVPMSPSATARDLPLPLISGGTAVLHLPYSLNEEDFLWLTTMLEKLRRSIVAPPDPNAIRVGDLVQWTSQGVDQFETPRRVLRIEQGFVFVEGTATGIPLAQVQRE